MSKFSVHTRINEGKSINKISSEKCQVKHINPLAKHFLVGTDQPLTANIDFFCQNWKSIALCDDGNGTFSHRHKK